MSVFPFFVELKEKKILFVGGGAIAGRRIKKLAETEALITLISPSVTPEVEELISEYKITYIPDYYQNVRERLVFSDYFLICSATDNIETEEMVYQDAKDAQVFCNIASDKDKSDIYFPGIVKKEDVTIAVSTEGKDPAKTKDVCRMLRENQMVLLNNEN